MAQLNRFRVYRASAGSGKTFTLVKEYLALALATPEPGAYRQILAITFTNKAAAEMRERILSTLVGLADASQQSKAWDIGKALMTELNISATELALRAKATHTHMLHHYNDVAVGTIDRFTHRVVRTFARDLGINPGFELLLEQTELVAETIDRLYELVGAEAEVTDALMDLVDEQMDDGKSTDLTTKLTDLSKALFDEESRLHLSRMDALSMTDFARVRNKLTTNRKQVEQKLKAEAEKAMMQLQNRGLCLTDLYGGSRGPGMYVQAWSEGIFKPLTEAVKAKELTPESWFTKGSKKVDLGLGAIFTEVIKQGRKAIGLIDTLTELTQSLFGLALLHKLRQLSLCITNEQGSLHISELNHLIAEVVATEPAPFIYERLGARYQHFMIDEFQDTSVLQWLNLMPLVHEGLARGGVSLVVGDGKQAIYRWRGGEVEQFNSLPKVFFGESVGILEHKVKGFVDLLTERSAALVQNHAAMPPLGQNWRSLPMVVQFNNEVFSGLQALLTPNLANIYHQLAQQPAKPQGGYVRVDFFEKKRSNKNTSSNTDDEDLTEAEKYRAQTETSVIRSVRSALADGYQLADIAIVVRKNVHASQLAELLKSNGLAVLSDEALLLSSSMAVQKMVAVLRHLNTPNDAINNAWIIQWLSATPSTNMAHLGFLGQGHDRQRAAQLVDSLLLPHTRSALSRLDLFSQFERIRMAVAHENDAYCDAFLSLVLKQAGSTKGDRAGFLEFWDREMKKASLSQLSGNAIRVLSIHKSKGLEFPVVIHPYCDYGPDTSKTYIWDDMHLPDGAPVTSVRIKPKSALTEGPHAQAIERENERQWLDNLNLMYVAFTRAAERLYVCAGANPDKKNDKISHVGEHLWKFLEQRATPENEGWFFEAGAPSAPLHQSIENASTTEIAQPILAEFWENRLQIRKQRGLEGHPGQIWAKRLFGVAMHAALEKLVTPETLDEVLNHLLTQGVIDPAQVPEMKARLHRLVKHPDLSGFFIPANHFRTEAEIITEQGQIVRPDRILHVDGQAQVLDYKTGMVKPQHTLQVQSYLLALRQLGLQATTGWVYYLESEEVVKVELP